MQRVTNSRPFGGIGDTDMNGHKSWGYWNVWLWITNTETFYRMACYYRNDTSTIKDAASKMHAYLLRHAKVLPTDSHPVQQGLALKKSTRWVYTPDGARYSLSAIRATLAGIPRDSLE